MNLIARALSTGLVMSCTASIAYDHGVLILLSLTEYVAATWRQQLQHHIGIGLQHLTVGHCNPARDTDGK